MVLTDGAVMDTETEETEAPSSKGKWLLIVGVIGALVVLGLFIDIPAKINGTLSWIEGLGAVGMGVFVVLYVAACVLVLPGSAITLGGGAIYGLPVGFALVSIGSTLGATATFIIARYLARDAVARKVEGNATFKAMDDAVAQQGWKIVFLTRLTPLIPFNIQNYGYGLTKVSLPQYMLASWVGMMPGTVLYVYIGTLGGSAAEGGQTTGQWVMNGIALVATIVVTVFITRMAKKALNDAVELSDETAEDGVES
jgi:uncharacterized membrane protein YdjX (TVP38/TMEM64 family)